MQRTDFLWNEFIYGGHWGSIGGAAVALSAMMLLNLQIRWEFLIITYLGTQCIYNYNHYKELHIDLLTNTPRVDHLNKYMTYLPFIIASYGIGFSIFLIAFGTLVSFLFGEFLLLLGLLFTYKGKKISTKVVGFKSIYASFSWALLIPFTAIYNSFSLNTSVFLISIYLFLRVMINTNFFDIKDIESDKKEKLLTLPMIFQNKQNWLNLLHILNLISFLPLLIGVAFKIIPLYSLFSLFLFFYAFYYIQKAKNEQVDIQSLSYVVTDGEFYYWPFLLFVGILLTTYLI